MRVLFAAPEPAWGGLFRELRAELPQHELEASGRPCLESLVGFDVLIPGMSPVPGRLLATSRRLRLVQQCGAGVDRVDLHAARTRGVWVANVPTWVSGAADAAAELGVFMMLALARDWRGMRRSLAKQELGLPRGRSLSGSTIGIVGLGSIGRALASRLKRFDARLVGLKRTGQQRCRDELGLDWVGAPTDLKRLLARSDFVVLCLTLTAESRWLMDREAFGAMRPGAFLINLGRGELVERGALEEALASGRVAGAGLDVYWEEPPDPTDPLFRYNIVATPHIAACTDRSIAGVVQVIAENIRRVALGLRPLHCLE